MTHSSLNRRPQLKKRTEFYAMAGVLIRTISLPRQSVVMNRDRFLMAGNSSFEVLFLTQQTAIAPLSNSFVVFT